MGRILSDIIHICGFELWVTLINGVDDTLYEDTKTKIIDKFR